MKKTRMQEALGVQFSEVELSLWGQKLSKTNNPLLGGLKQGDLIDVLNIHNNR
jgi:hypothetical protein